MDLLGPACITASLYRTAALAQQCTASPGLSLPPWHIPSMGSQGQTAAFTPTAWPHAREPRDEMAPSAEVPPETALKKQEKLQKEEGKDTTRIGDNSTIRILVCPRLQRAFSSTQG